MKWALEMDWTSWILELLGTYKRLLFQINCHWEEESVISREF